MARPPESSSQPQKLADHYASGCEAQRMARTLEAEPSLLGISAHLIAVGRR